MCAVCRKLGQFVQYFGEDAQIILEPNILKRFQKLGGILIACHAKISHLFAIAYRKTGYQAGRTGRSV